MDEWPYIFESPDGGETVYIRKRGETERRLYHISDKALEQANELEETNLWHAIRHAAKTDSTLQNALERVKILYYIKKQHGSET